MTGTGRWLADRDDPLAALLVEEAGHADRDGLLVMSQVAALAHWPAIEREPGRVSIVLRRAAAGQEAAWQDQLALLRHLIDASGRDIRLLALTEAAAAVFREEMARPVCVMPALPRRYGGARRLRLARSVDGLHIAWEGGDPRPARDYSFARLRRRAVLDAGEDDPDLADLAAFANGTAPPAAGQGNGRPVVVVVVPNGTGLGHVTRMLAVARHLRAELDARVVFWSFSRAVGLISRFGFEAVFRQTARHLGADPADWRAWETEDFAAALAGLKPDLVVQDSHALDAFVVEALARPGSGGGRLALVRRGMWQRHHLSGTAFASEDLADLVVEPGDLAAPADRGVTRGRQGRAGAFAAFAGSAPVTLTAPGDMLDARRARRALGLGRGRHCLVSLGSDAIADWTLLLRHLADAADAARVKLVWARSPLAAPDPDVAARRVIASVGVYPLAPYLTAFDGIVSAAGYNSFHELMQLSDRPVLLVPSRHVALDDQEARADYAASRGWATVLPRDRSERATVAAFMADLRAGKRVATRPDWRDGAAGVARSLAGLLEAEDAAT